MRLRRRVVRTSQTQTPATFEGTESRISKKRSGGGRYSYYRATATGERVKIVKRWLDPTDSSHETFWSVDEEGRFWLEDGTEYAAAEPPQELVDRHQAWIESRSKSA